jgi:hypothetical protein
LAVCMMLESVLCWYLPGSVDHLRVLDAIYAANGFARTERIPMLQDIIVWPCLKILNVLKKLPGKHLFSVNSMWQNFCNCYRINIGY